MMAFLFRSSCVVALAAGVSPVQSQPAIAFADGLPEFSYAGYHRSEVPLPEIDARYTVLEISDFGGVPSDGRSDRQAFVDALSAADEREGPVVIRFPEGRFDLRGSDDFMAPAISIHRSNLVLQGAGSKPGGTEFYFEAPSRDFALVVTPRGEKPHWRGRKLADLTAFGAIGGRSVTVKDATPLQPGMLVDIIGFLPEVEDAEAIVRYFAPHPPMAEGIAHLKGKPWRAMLAESHLVDRIEEDRVFFREPIYHEGHELGLEGGYLAAFTPQDTAPVTEFGIEGIALTSGYEELYFHYFSQASDGYHLLKFDTVLNGWARDLRFRNYTYAINTHQSMNNTFRDVLLEGNGGHLPISTTRGYGNLYSGVREFTDTHHGLGSTSNASLTVYHRSVQFASLEAHCGYPRATLHDRTDGLFAKVRPGGATFTPHHGKRLVFWNWNNHTAFYDDRQVLPSPDTIDFWPAGSRYGYFLPPDIIGLHGDPVTIDRPETDVARLESVGRAVGDASLFEAQLARRTGGLPKDLRDGVERFEAAGRHARVAFASPDDNHRMKRGQTLTIRAGFPAELSRQAIARVTVLGSRTPDLVDADPLATTEGTGPIKWKPAEDGVWMLWLRLETTTGSITTSRPRVVHVASQGQSTRAKPTPFEPARVYFQDEQMMAPSRKLRDQAFVALSEGGVAAYRAVLEQGRSDVLAPLVDRHPEVTKLIDGDPKSAFRVDGGWIPSAVVVDLGETRGVNAVTLKFPQELAGDASLRMEIQATNDPAAPYASSNDDRVWTSSLRRLGSTHIDYRLSPGETSALILFPTVEARFLRLFIHKIAPASIGEVEVGRL